MASVHLTLATLTAKDYNSLALHRRLDIITALPTHQVLALPTLGNPLALHRGPYFITALRIHQILALLAFGKSTRFSRSLPMRNVCVCRLEPGGCGTGPHNVWHRRSEYILRSLEGDGTRTSSNLCR